jgi:hypothetical protein
VHRLGGDDPSQAAGRRRPSSRAPPDDVAGAGQPEAVAVDRVDVVAGETRPDSTSSSVARFAANNEPTAPHPTMQIVVTRGLLRLDEPVEGGVEGIGTVPIPVRTARP